MKLTYINPAPQMFIKKNPFSSLIYDTKGISPHNDSFQKGFLLAHISTKNLFKYCLVQDLR